MNSALGKFLTVIITLFLFSYVGYQTFRYFYTGYKTESAYSFEVARAYTTRGILIRDETPISLQAQGVLRYTLEEGHKFISTTPIAQVYSSQAAAKNAEVRDNLRQEAEILQTVQTSTGKNQLQDLALLGNDISVALRNLTANEPLGIVHDVSGTRLVLISAISRRQLITGDAIGFNERIAELEGQAPQGETAAVLRTTQSGYFSRFVDHYEDQFTPEMLETLDGATVEELTKQEYFYDTEAFGKCVNSYRWYYATTIPLEDAAMFQEDAEVTLSFVGSNEPPVSGWVSKVVEEKAHNRAMLLIQSNDINGDTVSRRCATVKLGFSDYKGVRFSKKALRIQNGKKGVFVKGNSAVKFKEVDIVYTGKDFYLSKLDYSSDIYLNIFDVIITEGADLYDGKPLE